MKGVICIQCKLCKVTEGGSCVSIGLKCNRPLHGLGFVAAKSCKLKVQTLVKLLLRNFILYIHSIDVVPSIVVDPSWFHIRAHKYDQGESFLI